MNVIYPEIYYIDEEIVGEVYEKMKMQTLRRVDAQPILDGNYRLRDFIVTNNPDELPVINIGDVVNYLIDLETRQDLYTLGIKTESDRVPCSVIKCDDRIITAITLTKPEIKFMAAREYFWPVSSLEALAWIGS